MNKLIPWLLVLVGCHSLRPTEPVPVKSVVTPQRETTTSLQEGLLVQWETASWQTVMGQKTVRYGDGVSEIHLPNINTAVTLTWTLRNMSTEPLWVFADDYTWLAIVTAESKYRGGVERWLITHFPEVITKDSYSVLAPGDVLQQKATYTGFGAHGRETQINIGYTDPSDQFPPPPGVRRIKGTRAYGLVPLIVIDGYEKNTFQFDDDHRTYVDACRSCDYFVYRRTHRPKELSLTWDTVKVKTVDGEWYTSDAKNFIVADDAVSDLEYNAVLPSAVVPHWSLIVLSWNLRNESDRPLWIFEPFTEVAIIKDGEVERVMYRTDDDEELEQRPIETSRGYMNWIVRLHRDTTSTVQKGSYRVLRPGESVRRELRFGALAFIGVAHRYSIRTIYRDPCGQVGDWCDIDSRRLDEDTCKAFSPPPGVSRPFDGDGEVDSVTSVPLSLEILRPGLKDENHPAPRERWTHN